ncbi:MAG: Dolichyl-phosphate mannose synthase related protein [Acidimicrobiales bacterium]|nr:Dolichyl-phosphate mannose synthase related protein [Acidimicrobiales bacterium]
MVPVRDGAGTIGACLDALAGQRGEPAFDVVVVDNGSTDATASIVAGHAIGARLITEARPGSYAARNAGIAAAAGRVLAFTDADCRPAPDWLAAGLRALTDTGASLAGGAVVLEPGRGRWARYDRAIYLDQRHFVESDGFAATANLFAEARVFDDVGPFDGGLVSSGDVEFCRRATSAGHRLVYAPDAVVVHPPRTTLIETWRLHRRLGAGWAQLAARGAGGSRWREPALRIDLGSLAARSDGDRRRDLLPAHVVAMTARWLGRVTGRP